MSAIVVISIFLFLLLIVIGAIATIVIFSRKTEPSQSSTPSTEPSQSSTPSTEPSQSSTPSVILKNLGESCTIDTDCSGNGSAVGKVACCKNKCVKRLKHFDGTGKCPDDCLMQILWRKIKCIG